MKLSCKIEQYRVSEKSQVLLNDWPTQVKKLYRSGEHYRQLLDQYRDEISELQGRLYAHDRYALLLIFQGMDASGKDGAIRHVMSGINPQGCQVYSFKQPSSEELDHDFLWRTNKRLPERGRIGIFNRSYYEEVLVARVLPQVLEKQRVPIEFIDPPTLWQQRFHDIVNMEDYLHRNGTRIVKFFLHLSKNEQRKRLLARIDDPNKNWKLAPEDVEARKLWDDYQKAYAQCLSATSAQQAPWYVVPADDKRNAHLIISHIIVQTLRDLPLHYPRVTDEHRKQLQLVRKGLAKS